MKAAGRGHIRSSWGKSWSKALYDSPGTYVVGKVSSQVEQQFPLSYLSNNYIGLGNKGNSESNWELQIWCPLYFRL